MLSLLSTPYSYAQAVAYSQGDTHILSGSVEVIWCRPLPAEQSPGEQRHHDQHLQQRRAILQIGNRRIDPIQQVCHGRAVSDEDCAFAGETTIQQQTTSKAMEEQALRGRPQREH